MHATQHARTGSADVALDEFRRTREPLAAEDLGEGTAIVDMRLEFQDLYAGDAAPAAAERGGDVDRYRTCILILGDLLGWHVWL